MLTEQKKLLSPQEYKTSVPLSVNLLAIKRALDERLKENLATRRKFTVICGPCSADDPVAMERYLSQLKKISDECQNLLVVARIYTSKPHSNGDGYKGTAFQLHSDDPVDINAGIVRCRRMMIGCIELGLPVADELLYPEIFQCLDDLVSYWFVGARSAEDSFHRNLASSLNVCCGVKNPTDGSIDKAADSLYAITRPCVFPFNGAQVVTDGCKYAHIVLRGGFRDGVFSSNISPAQIAQVKKMLRERGMNDFVLADLNHANSGKIAFNQIPNARVALQGGADGVMIESYLGAGGLSSQFGVSQTDDCLDFAATESLLRELNAAFGKR